jgi:hypothetical protein
MIKYYCSKIKYENHLYKTKEGAPYSPQGFPSYLTLSQIEKDINIPLENSASYSNEDEPCIRVYSFLL